MAIAAVGLVLVIAFVVVCVGSMSGEGSREPQFAAADTVPTGDVALSTMTFEDGRVRFYRYVTGTGDQTRFFVIRSADGVVRAAFDACDSCYRQKRGFRQAGNHMICNACGRAILSQHVNVLKGGCNPAILEHTIEGDRLIIRTVALERGSRYFE